MNAAGSPQRLQWLWGSLAAPLGPRSRTGGGEWNQWCTHTQLWGSAIDAYVVAGASHRHIGALGARAGRKGQGPLWASRQLQGSLDVCMFSHGRSVFPGCVYSKGGAPVTGIKLAVDKCTAGGAIPKYIHSDRAPRLLPCTHAEAWTCCWWGPWALAGASAGQAGEKTGRDSVADVSECKYLWSPWWLCCLLVSSVVKLLEYLCSRWLGTTVAPAMCLLLGAPAFSCSWPHLSVSQLCQSLSNMKLKWGPSWGDLKGWGSWSLTPLPFSSF